MITIHDYREGGCGTLNKCAIDAGITVLMSKICYLRGGAGISRTSAGRK